MICNKIITFLRIFLQEFCKENETERITSFFLKQEEENFALFNYVNELNHEIELLNTNIKLMEEQLGKIFGNFNPTI